MTIAHLIKGESTVEDLFNRVNELITAQTGIPLYTPALGKRLYVIPESGQSLSIGTGTSAPIFADELAGAYLFNGIDPWGSREHLIADSQVVSLKPYKERYSRQTHGYTMLRSLKDGIADGDELLYMPFGIGARALVDLGRGTEAYNNFLIMLQVVVARAAEVGASVVFPFVGLIQGESNSATLRASYVAQQRPYQDAFLEDIAKITGQPTLAMLIDQTGANYCREVAKAQFQYTQENDDAYLSCPKYPLNRLYYKDSSDVVHLNADGYNIQGDYRGLAGKGIIAKEGSKCLEPIAYNIVGDDLHITLNVPVPPMVIDITVMPEAPSYGIMLIKPDLTEVLPTVTISGDKLILDAGEPITSGWTVDCGFTLDDSATHPSGEKLPCTNIRDSQDIPSSAAGYTLHNWIVQFDYVVSEQDIVVEPVEPPVVANLWIHDDPITFDGTESTTASVPTGFKSDLELGDYAVSFDVNGDGGSLRFRIGDDSVFPTGATAINETMTVTSLDIKRFGFYQFSNFIGTISNIVIEKL